MFVALFILLLIVLVGRLWHLPYDTYCYLFYGPLFLWVSALLREHVT